MCISTGNFDSIFFSLNYALFELRNLTKMKDTTETVDQRNSTETAQQNFVKLCSYEGHNMYICISTGNFDCIFFLGVTPFLNLEIWPNERYYSTQFVSATPLKPLNRIFWNFVVMKDIMCRCAYPQEILIPFFSLGVTPFLNLEIWPKWKILLNTVC